MFKQAIITHDIVQSNLCKQLSLAIGADVSVINSGLAQINVNGQTDWYYSSDTKPKHPICPISQPTTAEQAVAIFDSNKSLAAELKRVHEYLHTHVW